MQRIYRFLILSYYVAEDQSSSSFLLCTRTIITMATPMTMPAIQAIANTLMPSPLSDSGSDSDLLSAEAGSVSSGVSAAEVTVVVVTVVVSETDSVGWLSVTFGEVSVSEVVTGVVVVVVVVFGAVVVCFVVPVGFAVCTEVEVTVCETVVSSFTMIAPSASFENASGPN